MLKKSFLLQKNQPKQYQFYVQIKIFMVFIEAVSAEVGGRSSEEKTVNVCSTKKHCLSFTSQL